MKYSYSLFLSIVLVFIPCSLFSYIGPGTGITAIAAFIAVVVIVIIAIIGFIWYPLKRIIKKNKK